MIPFCINDPPALLNLPGLVPCPPLNALLPILYLSMLYCPSFPFLSSLLLFYTQVYYFGLPDAWEASQVGNDAALSMLLRVVHDGDEADGCESVTHWLSAWIRPLVSGSSLSYQGCTGTGKHTFMHHRFQSVHHAMRPSF